MFSISSVRCRQAMVALAVFVVGFAHADGPVSVANLPGGGGNVVVDTDVTEGGGLGQRWGRAGGRSITYHVNSPGTFSALSFGVQLTNQPSLAFDGAVTGATGELMNYNAGLSNPAGGIAVWSGSAVLQLVNQGPVQIPTRFTLTITTAGGAPISMAFQGGNYPFANVLASGDFKANLLFEMADTGNPNVFHPVLDYYDALPTFPGQPPQTNSGPVMTGVSTGFYYTVQVQGMTLEQHDAHVQALFDSISPQINNMNGKINFIRQDWDGRWNGIQDQVFDTKTSINNTLMNSISPTLTQIQQTVSNLQFPNVSNLANKQDTDSLRDMLMIVLGVSSCPPQAPPGFCTDFKSLYQLGQAANATNAKLNTLATQASVDGILIGLNNALTGVASQSSVNAIAAQVSGLATQANVNGILIGLNNALVGVATQSSVNALGTQVAALQSSLNAAQAKIDDLQDALDSVGSSSLQVTLMQIASAKTSSSSRRWIMKVTRDGVLVSSSLTRLGAVRLATSKSAGSVANVMGSSKVVVLTPGLYDVTLTVGKDTPEAAAYLFEATFTSGGVSYVGSALTDGDKQEY